MWKLMILMCWLAPGYDGRDFWCYVCDSTENSQCLGEQQPDKSVLISEKFKRNCAPDFTVCRKIEKKVEDMTQRAGEKTHPRRWTLVNQIHKLEKKFQLQYLVMVVGHPWEQSKWLIKQRLAKVAGDLTGRRSSCVFLTVHDIGSNHDSLVHFASHPVMEALSSKSVYLHLVVPGHEHKAPELGEKYPFPTLEELAEELVVILDSLKVPQVICIGVGAGANIITRFAMLFPSRCHGLVLLQPSVAAAGFREKFKEKLSKLSKSIDTDHYLFLHKFGSNARDFQIKELQKILNKDINKKNLKTYIKSFMERDEIIGKVRENISCEVLVIVGTKSSYAAAAEEVYKQIKPGNASFIKFENVLDVIEEVPDRLGEALLFFCQGIGLLAYVPSGRSTPCSSPPDSSLYNSRKTSLNNSRTGSRENLRQRRPSMQEMDVPDITRLSLQS